MAYPGFGAPPPGGYGGVSKELVRYIWSYKSKPQWLAQMEGVWY